MIEIARDVFQIPVMPWQLVNACLIANPKDLLVLKGLIEAGKITSVVDRTYPLEKTSEAIRYLEQGHAAGKVIIRIQESL